MNSVISDALPVVGRSNICPVCDGSFNERRRVWLVECAGCGFLKSTLQPRIRAVGAPSAIDEAARAQALGALRSQNFERILDRLGAHRPEQRGRLLEVGCAHGWFVERAARRGYDAVGIEPDVDMHALAASRGLSVWSGFFPDDVPTGDTFDVIVFNDVFEHLPDVDGAMAACRRLLRPGGHLMVNIPSSAGFFYRVATTLDRINVGAPLDRMWQEKFPSPHLSYFTPEQLERLAARHGFSEDHRSTLPTLSLTDLWSRVRYDRSASLFSSIATFLAVGAVLPALSFLPADISLQIFKA